MGDIPITAERPGIGDFVISVPVFVDPPKAGIEKLRRIFEKRKGAARRKVGVILAAGLLESASETETEQTEEKAEAERILKELVESDSPPAEALAVYAGFLENENRADEARKYWKRYLETNPPTKSGERGYALLKLAFDALLRGNSGEAADLLSNEKHFTREHRVVRSALNAWIYFSRKRFDKAYELTKEAYAQAVRLTDGKEKAGARKRPQNDINTSLVLVNRQLLIQQAVLFYSYFKRAQGSADEFRKMLSGADLEQLPNVLWSLFDLYFATGRYGEVLSLADLRKEGKVDRFAITLALVESHMGLGDEKASLDLLHDLAKQFQKSVTEGSGDEEEQDKEDGDAGKTHLTQENMEILKEILLETAQSLHALYTESFVVAHGLDADRSYEIYLMLPALTQSEKKRALEFREELQRFHRQVQKGLPVKEQSAATGMLSVQSVERIMRRYVPQLAHCVEIHLVDDGLVPDRVLLQLSFAPTGAVTEAGVTSVNNRMLPSPDLCPEETADLCRCMTRKCLGWRFPTYKGRNRPTILQVPLTFARQQPM